MVNGENPHVGFDFYLDTIRRLHEALPDVFLKCYTASEIHHMTTLSGLTHEEVLRELQAAGLGALTGGGAEVFADRVRRLVAPGKEHPDIWFHVHDTAHRLGIPTHCTLLYGHVETYEERIEHLLRLRDQQDRTGGFLAFIPLAFHPGEHGLRAPRLHVPDGRRRPEDARRLAPGARQHPEHQGVLDLADDAGRPGRAPLRRQRRPGHARPRGDLPRRRLERPAPSRRLEELVRVVRAAGRIPVQRDTLYNELRRWVTRARSMRRLTTGARRARPACVILDARSTRCRHRHVTLRALASTASGSELWERVSRRPAGIDSPPEGGSACCATATACRERTRRCEPSSRP